MAGRKEGVHASSRSGNNGAKLGFEEKLLAGADELIELQYRGRK